MEKESNKKKGDDGEALAEKYLSERGYEIIARKWRSGRFEVDLIMQSGKNLVFIEVKTRYSNTFGEPWEAVNKGKRSRIMAGADAFLKSTDIDLEPRFDIVSIIKYNGKCAIEHIENAFYPMA
jgi:putative endonuclease